MSEEPVWDKASRLGATMAYFMNLAALLACQRISAKATQWPPREHLLEHVDGFRELASGDGSFMIAGKPADLRDTLPYVLKLRELLAVWEPSSDVPPDIRDNARALLHAFGIPEPPEGWDNFEGWPDQDAPNADAGEGEQGGAE